jgi:hypothetical protein
LSKDRTWDTFDPRVSDQAKFVSGYTAMPNATHMVFREEILAEQQMTCTYAGRSRQLCPHIMGTNKSGEEAVLAWQFGGESSGKL